MGWVIQGCGGYYSGRMVHTGVGLGGSSAADPGFPVGGVDLVGVCGLPSQLRFIKFVCQNERIGSIRGVHAGCTPPNLPMVMQGWGGVGHVGVGWGGSHRGVVGWNGSCRGGVGITVVGWVIRGGWVMEGWNGPYRVSWIMEQWVGHAGVGHTGVGWAG